ncbi:MAG: SAM-dependent methyltransferase, partial [Planctomycetota bacterium]
MTDTSHSAGRSAGLSDGGVGESFAPEWLRLRRDADARARTESTRALTYALSRPGRAPTRRPLDVIDLGV